MLLRANELLGLGVHATDGDLGKVGDLLFDDQKWAIRYFVVDTGGWLTGRQVLISPASVQEANWSDERLIVNLSRRQVEDSPDISTDLPVSRQHENEVVAYYGWPVYWGGTGLWGGWGAVGPVGAGYGGAVAHPALASGPGYGGDGYAGPDEGFRDEVREAEEREDQREEQHHDPHLRSARELKGYGIAARDADIGHVEDLLIDEENWAIRYLAVDTGKWLPGRKVLVPPQWIERISYPDSQVHVDLTRDQIKLAPEWNPDEPISRPYEEALHGYYGRPGYWQEERLMSRWSSRREPAAALDTESAPASVAVAEEDDFQI